MDDLPMAARDYPHANGGAGLSGGGLLDALALLLAGLAYAGTPPPAAQPEAEQARSLLEVIGDEIVHVRAYQPYGIELRRGFEMDTRPKQNVYGDCRSQRITFFSKLHPTGGTRVVGNAPELDQLTLVNRYRRPEWRETKAPRDCGDPLEGAWIAAKDDYTFYVVAKLLGQVAAKAHARGAGPATYGFRYTCGWMGGVCADPGSKLTNALSRAGLEASLEGRTVVLRGLGFAMWVTPAEKGQIDRVDVEYSIPPLS